MKPNFEQMTYAEIKEFAFQHREDQDAWDAFFKKRQEHRDPNTKVYPANQTPEEMKQAILEKIREAESKREQQ